MAAAMREDWVARLTDDRTRLDLGGYGERVADVLRERITEGVFPPGVRLSENALCEALGVSRNTLREAFRLLSHEGLLTHEFNRGVFIRELTAADVRDLYAFRRIIEGAAVLAAADAPPGALDRVGEAVEAAEVAAAAGDWAKVGTANMRFHQAIADLAGNSRLSQTARRLLAELRLVFLVVPAVQAFHQPYIRDNRQIHQLLVTGEFVEAHRVLTAYLDAAERQLLDAFPPQRTGGAPSAGTGRAAPTNAPR
ncbi:MULTISPECIES: GntR family transcriptional regulator [unclassified Micromonospora]|uniref:GntR family transcriptional regulator n=1 Tax=unclassified Micromonospora TaxID=2617518 RepID=UPI003A84C2E8